MATMTPDSEKKLVQELTYRTREESGKERTPSEVRLFVSSAVESNRPAAIKRWIRETLADKSLFLEFCRSI